jgi:hypothetical protein
MIIGSFGLTGTREAAAGAGQTTARATGPLGSLTYAHFVTPRAGFEIAAAVLDADASASYANNRAAAVTAFLVGLTFSPASLALSRTVRPFVSAAVGSYSHHVADVSAGATTEARSQSQAGGRLGAGINFFVARHFAMQLAADYHAVAPFDAVNGVEKDVSGLGLTFGLALAWGGK